MPVTGAMIPDVAELDTRPAEVALEPSPVPGISRNVFFLSLVSFAADVASEMVYPLLPIFLTATIGAPVAALGIIEGIAEGTASTLKVVSGWFSDRIHRRRQLVAVGYFLSAISKGGIALATLWPHVLAARFSDRVGKGVRTSPRDALIVESSDPAHRGRAFGFHRGMDTAGAVLGPLAGLGFLVLLGENNLRPVFAIAVVPGLLSVVFVSLVREPRSAAPERPKEARAGDPGESLWARLHGAPPAFWAFLGVTLLFAFGNSSDTFLILRGKNLGLSITAVVLAYVAFNAVYSALATPFGIASDRFGRRIVLLLGFVLFAGVYLGFGIAGQGLEVWPLFMAYGAFMALTEGVGRALAADLSPADRRGTFLGLYHTGIGVMALVASALAGVLWEEVRPAAPFFLGSATALAAAVALVLIPFPQRAPGS